MTLFLMMLPFYLLGNIHCMGMCGPLVMMIGQHRYKYFYFLGRITSFSLAALFASSLGSVINIVLKEYHIPAITSFLFGGIILIISVFSLFGRQYPGSKWASQKLAPYNNYISKLLLEDKIWPTFLFGFLTLLLPCGQSLIVFSACALSGDPLTGLFNGFAFSLLTSPSLWMAMRIHKLISHKKIHFNTMIGILGIIIGFIGFLRGMAEIDLIPHMILNTNSASYYHIVLY